MFPSAASILLLLLITYFEVIIIFRPNLIGIVPDSSADNESLCF